MSDARLVLIHIADLDPTATHFNLRFSADGGTTWTPYSTASATPSSPEDLAVGLLDANDDYVLDGVNSPSGNMAAASYAGNWYSGRLKGTNGYGNWSPLFGVTITPSRGAWPTVSDVYQKLRYTNPGGLGPEVTDDVNNILAAIIAEFESPPNGAAGGTGRSFTPITETRTFDGTGWPELRVPDIVPGAALSVSVWDAVLSDVILADPVQPYLGHNRLVRPQGAGAILGASYLTPGIFPVGLQNINVTATWGNLITPDIWEAVRSEAAARALSQGAVPLSGIGDMLSIGSYSINTAAGVSVWKESSPIAVMHRTYEACVARYRDRGAWRRALVARRMS